MIFKTEKAGLIPAFFCFLSILKTHPSPFFCISHKRSICEEKEAEQPNLQEKA